MLYLFVEYFVIAAIVVLLRGQFSRIHYAVLRGFGRLTRNASRACMFHLSGVLCYYAYWFNQLMYPKQNLGVIEYLPRIGLAMFVIGVLLSILQPLSCMAVDSAFALLGIPVARLAAFIAANLILKATLAMQNSFAAMALIFFTIGPVAALLLFLFIPVIIVIPVFMIAQLAFSSTLSSMFFDQRTAWMDISIPWIPFIAISILLIAGYYLGKKHQDRI